MAERPLHDYSEDELRDALFKQANSIGSFSYNDVAGELERKVQQRYSHRNFVLGVLATIVSVISLLASVLVALFK